MAVIFGEFNHSEAIDHSNLPKIHNALFWKDANYYKWSGYSYDIGILINGNRNFREEDFHSFDKEEGLLVWIEGQIYNRDEIKYKHFKDQFIPGNPRLVLELFKKEGTPFINLLNGDFSIIIINQKEKNIFFFRDHIGIKPMSLGVMGASVFFSSDFIALGKALFPGDPMDKDFIIQLIQDPDYIDYKKTLTPSVKKLLPAHYAVFDRYGLTQNKFWFPEKIKINKNIDAESAIYSLKSLTSDAVNIRVNRKFSTGAHLSGGLDSGFVTSLARMRKKDQEDFFGFSWTNSKTKGEPEGFNERVLIGEIEMASNIKAIFCNVEPKEYWEHLKDYPCFSSQFYEKEVLKESAKRKVKEIFSGWGGDEFISINNRGVFYDLFFALNWRTLFRKKPLLNFKAFTGMILFQVFLPSIGLGHLKRHPKDQWSYRFFNFPFNKRPKRNKALFNYKSRRDAHLSLLYNYHLPWRTEIWDLLGSRSGIEYRYPLLDKRIIEYILQIPSSVLASFPFSRPLIREVSKGVLPEKVRLHQSKFDAARLNHLFSFYKETLPFFLSELKEIKENPDLDFLNFEEIEAECKNIESQPDFDHKFDFLIFLNNLKTIHEFTKSYRNNV